jgi:cytoskeleton protein RodZ
MVTIKALKSAWVQVRSDGKVVYSAEMDPSDAARRQVSLHANDKMLLVLGNAGGVDVSINGKPAAKFGQENQRREVTITRQGVQQ